MSIIASTFRREDVLVFNLSGSLEVAKQVKFKEELVKLIPFDTNQVVLDFSAVDFIDSACLGVLIGLSKALKQKKGDLRLSCLKEDVKSILQITRLEKVFPIFETTDSAITSYVKP